MPRANWKQHAAIRRSRTLIELCKVAGRKCWYCSRPITFKECEVDHIIPKSKGGKNTLSNLAMACKSCNRAKDVMSLHEFLEWLQWIRRHSAPVQAILDRAEILPEQQRYYDDFQKGLRKPDKCLW